MEESLTGVLDSETWLARDVHYLPSIHLESSSVQTGLSSLGKPERLLVQLDPEHHLPYSYGRLSHGYPCFLLSILLHCTCHRQIQQIATKWLE